MSSETSILSCVETAKLIAALAEGRNIGNIALGQLLAHILLCPICAERYWEAKSADSGGAASEDRSEPQQDSESDELKKRRLFLGRRFGSSPDAPCGTTSQLIGKLQRAEVLSDEEWDFLESHATECAPCSRALAALRAKTGG